MAAPHRPRHDEADKPADHLDDLRAQLPAEFRNAPDGEIAQLWLAWNAVRHGHDVDYLVEILAVPADIAEHLIDLAGHSAPPR